MKEAVQINLATLTKQVEDGWKKDALASHYGIPVSQMGTALKQAGLKIRKLHKPAFVLVTDTVVENNEEVGDINVAEAVVVVEETLEPSVENAISGTDVENTTENATDNVAENPVTEIPTWK